MAIEEDKVRNLIKSYEVYEEECRDSGSEIDLSRAGLFRTVIADLRLLLPRKSLADLDPHGFEDYSGEWVKYGDVNAIVLSPETYSGKYCIVLPSKAHCIWVAGEELYPTDKTPAWNGTE